MPQGQSRTTSFTVSGFTLPVSMTYSDTPKPQVSGIAVSRRAAISFVSRLIMQMVTDVLIQQGHSAGLPDAIISAILDQLMLRISYLPLECKSVTTQIPGDGMFPATEKTTVYHRWHHGHCAMHENGWWRSNV
ncbi:hypothetical protein KIN20_000546 [Parelaphostrongylus tenuis]|uniref:Uncharacterized protein n=1 Tax=Parelaphostrongylus tenuis TaxID=148309 RepID=A0AAD5QG51_PARTN|nr:hypothetical protein KIN20_000546 [Parelaphostrongylus tenuis]